jgi:hypothetical protein
MPLIADGPASQDLLRRMPLLSGLAEELLDPATATPVVVGVFGPWGSGKTTAMRLVEHLLREGPRTSPASVRVRTVWFDPWRYQFDDHPALNLVHDVAHSLGLDRVEKVKNALKAIARALTDDVRIPVIGWRLGKARDVLNEAGEAAYLRRSEMVLLRQHFGEILGEAVRAEDDAAEGTGRLIVFIDDLDRCQASQALKLLEALKLFLDVPGCVYVLGVDPAVLAPAFASGSLAGAAGHEDYLEKLVQVPIYLPPLPDAGVQAVFEEAFGLRSRPRSREFTALVTVTFSESARQLKRFANLFLIHERAAEQHIGVNAYSDVALASVLIIRMCSNELFDLLRLDPGRYPWVEGETPTDAVQVRIREIVERDRRLAAGPARATLTRLDRDKLPLYLSLGVEEASGETQTGRGTTAGVGTVESGGPAPVQAQPEVESEFISAVRSAASGNYDDGDLVEREPALLAAALSALAATEPQTAVELFQVRWRHRPHLYGDVLEGMIRRSPGLALQVVSRLGEIRAPVIRSVGSSGTTDLVRAAARAGRTRLGAELLIERGVHDPETLDSILARFSTDRYAPDVLDLAWSIAPMALEESLDRLPQAVRARYRRDRP